MDLNKRPTEARIHLENLRFNAKQIISKLPKQTEVMGIIKANAYGHGSVFVARTLESCGIKKFAVATFAEGLELRQQGIRSEIHILNGLMAPIQEYLSNRLYPVIYQLEQLKEITTFLNNENRDFMVSLKFDTGMGRLGFLPSQIDEVYGMIRYAQQLKIIAVLTHLAKADVGDDEVTGRQYTLFGRLRDILADRGMKATAFSICNSAAILDGKFEDFSWVRPGLALYGCYPNERQMSLLELRPVLELKTKILSLKKMQPHSAIGYGGTFETQRESNIAILPIGYADGYPRLASNRGHVLVRGHKAPIVGRISMDLMTIDVTDVPEVALYDDVVLIGQQGEEIIRAEQVAQWADTISYEILCGISARVPRVYEGT